MFTHLYELGRMVFADKLAVHFSIPCLWLITKILNKSIKDYQKQPAEIFADLMVFVAACLQGNGGTRLITFCSNQVSEDKEQLVDIKNTVLVNLKLNSIAHKTDCTEKVAPFFLFYKNKYFTAKPFIFWDGLLDKVMHYVSNHYSLLNFCYFSPYVYLDHVIYK